VGVVWILKGERAERGRSINGRHNGTAEGGVFVIEEALSLRVGVRGFGLRYGLGMVAHPATPSGGGKLGPKFGCLIN